MSGPESVAPEKPLQENDASSASRPAVMSPRDPIPVRMLNEHVYCPRLYALEWLQGEWADSADTVAGRTVHRRVDKESRVAPPEPEEDPERPVVVRSLHLGSTELGLVGRIDLVEFSEGGVAVPVDYKKGTAPDLPEGAWPPERVQVCAQGLLLREHGYTSTHGVLYFAGSRRRVTIPFDAALVALTREHIRLARAVAEAGELPPPLVDSPKCNGCSLVGICLPDEHNLLAGKVQEVRPLLPPRDDAVPLYVQARGAYLGKSHDEIAVRQRDREEVKVRLEETSRVVLLGNVSVSTPLLNELSRRDIAVAYHSYGGWFWGLFSPATGRNVISRMAQHRAAADPERALALARRFVVGKIANCRVLLRRNGEDVPSEVLRALREHVDLAAEAGSIGSLFGIEGNAARLYFGELPRMIRGELRDRFEMHGRNRRPPRDPVNALLSFAYACLVREFTAILHGIGLDPYVGFLHQPRHGRPALSLDLMEEFRPVVADSVVINAINNGVVQRKDFVERSTGVAIGDAARKRFIQVLERRLDELVTHPVFNTRLSYRRVLEVQARLLAKVLTGELDTYPEHRVR